MRRFHLVLALAFVASVGVGVGVATGFSAAPSAVPAARPGPNLFEGVNFISTCRFSHRNQDDLIVFPLTHGNSHDHTYFGNTTTNGESTLESLRAASTTCRRRADTAAYWVPTLMRNGEPVEPIGATIYYRRRTLAPVRPFPAGLEMIAGESHAMSPQRMRVTFWNCGVEGNVPRSSDIPTCPSGRGSSLRLHINFPNCWDGQRLDSEDHKSHMAYSVRGQCPADHPVAVPAISLIVRYGIAGEDGLELSSGGAYSGHGDFVNAWSQPVLNLLVNGCLNTMRHCARGF